MYDKQPDKIQVMIFDTWYFEELDVLPCAWLDFPEIAF